MPSTGHAAVPPGAAFLIRHATLPAALVDGVELPRAGEGLVRANLSIAGGRITAIATSVARHGRVDFE